MLAHSLAEKREFIVWFLRTNRLKKPEAAHVLEFIRDNKQLLSRVEFSKKLSDKKDALLVSAVFTNTFPFDFRLNHVSFGSVDEVIHQLKENPPTKLFLWLSFASPPICKMCSQSNKRQLKARPHPQAVAHKMLVEAVRTVNQKETQRKKILQRIDQCLDAKNQQEFQRLTAELQKLSSE